MLDGEEITVENITLKYFVGDNAEKFNVSDAEGQLLDYSVSGKYISFDFTSGNYFKFNCANIKAGIWAFSPFATLTTDTISKLSFCQGGKDVPSYPILRNFGQAEESSEFDDEDLFNKLFDKKIIVYVFHRRETNEISCLAAFVNVLTVTVQLRKYQNLLRFRITLPK